MARRRSLTSDLKQFGIKSLPGMNNKVEELDQQINWVGKAQNCRFEDEPGTVVKREPTTYYNSSTISATNPIVGLFRHYGSSGTIKSIAICGSSAYVGDDSTGTFAAIRTSLTSGKRASFVTYKDLTIVSNGFDNPWVYDGAADNVTWELGSCKALTGSSTGITATDVSYQVTIDTDSYICGAVSNTIASLSNEDVELSNIPLGPSGTANRKIFRKDSGTSGAYKLVATISDNTTTTYTDSTPSGSLGANIGAVTDDMPVGSILNLHRERLFISGDPNNPNRIYYSDPYLPWYITQTTNTSYMDIEPDDGDEIMGIPIQLGVMACIKKNTIRKVHITQPTSGHDPSNWYAEDPSSFIGSPSQWSIVQTPHGVVFLGWNHWYVWTGSIAKPIIDEFDYSEILRANYDDVFAYWLQEDILLCGYADSTVAAQYNNRMMRWNFKRQALSYDVLDVNVIIQHTGDDEAGEVFYGDSQQGFVYKSELSELSYRLQTKTEADDGTSVTTYVGGTEAAPYIEIGSESTAEAIPEDIVIFWSNNSTTPGSGWTEITGVDNRYVRIDYDNDPGTTGNCTHSSGGSLTTVDHVTYRAFYKNSSTTETVFPDGAIIMWDQDAVPTGFIEVADYNHYVRLKEDLSTGTFTDQEMYIDSATQSASSTNLDHKTGFRFIKKTGEQDTWNGVSEYCYCLFYSQDHACTPANATNNFTDNAHGLSDDDRVEFGGSVAPTGITFGTIYYIVNSTTNTFEVSATSGGATVTFSDDGTSVTYQVRKQYGWEDSEIISGGSAYDNRFIEIQSTGGPTNSDGGTGTYSIDTIQFTATTHNTTGGSNAANGYDGNTSSAHSGSYSGGDGGGSVTVTSEHVFDRDYDIDSLVIKYNAQSSCSGSYDRSRSCSIKTEWKADGGSYATVTGSNNSASGGGDGTSSVSKDTTLTSLSLSNVRYIKTTCAASSNAAGGEGSYSGSVNLYEIQTSGVTVGKYVTFRMMRKVLGKMLDFNTALTTSTARGLWTSPGLELSAETLYNIAWNESKVSGDDIQFFTRTGSSQSAVEDGTSTTPDQANDKFTNAGHNLSNGDRVQILATTAPTGIDLDRIYFVVGVAGNDWQVEETSGGGAVNFTSNGSGVTYKKWDGPYTDPNGESITSTAADWISYLIYFTAADTTSDNPRAYFADGFVAKINYLKGSTTAENAVEFIYSIGFRNFDSPMVDKIFKKIFSRHEGTTGQLLVQWETENASSSFTIDLDAYPERWDSFFPDNAMGKEIKITFYKNDLNDFKLREIKGLFTPEPLIS